MGRMMQGPVSRETGGPFHGHAGVHEENSGCRTKPRCTPDRGAENPNLTEDHMAKQLKSNMTGAVADIIGETRKYYWVLSRKTGEPFTVLKGNNHWVPYTPKPEVGDVWAPTPEGAHYRILGVSEKAGLWHMCLADQWHGGKYPKPKDGIQVDPAKEVRVFTRSYPDILDWVFIERPES